MRNFSIAAATLAVLLPFASIAPAAETAAAEASAGVIVGDSAAGATKAATCTACHGLNGNSVNPEWPVLAGQNAVYLTQQIRAFRAGHRVNVLMFPMVQSLTDQDIADLSAFFSKQTPAGLEADPSYWEAGKALYRGGDVQRAIPACIACHGPIGHGVPAAGYPALQAQHSVYTVSQLTAYANDTRYARDDKGRSLGTPHAHMMNTISARLTAEERRNLASYLQGVR